MEERRHRRRFSLEKKATPRYHKAFQGASGVRWRFLTGSRSQLTDQCGGNFPKKGNGRPKRRPFRPAPPPRLASKTFHRVRAASELDLHFSFEGLPIPEAERASELEIGTPRLTLPAHPAFRPHPPSADLLPTGRRLFLLRFCRRGRNCVGVEFICKIRRFFVMYPATNHANARGRRT